MGAETLVTRGALMEQRLPLSVSMTPAELLIIYLAAGAPFGVYGFFSEADHLGKLHIARPFLKFALWPVFATQLIFLELFRRYIDDSADRKSTRLNSSHSQISYAVFCLKKKTNCYT